MRNKTKKFNFMKNSVLSEYGISTFYFSISVPPSIQNESRPLVLHQIDVRD